MESILTSIKKLLGLTDEYTQFDQDIIIHINSVFSILTQLGIGPKDGFSINDEYAQWENFLSDNEKLLATVRSYMYLKVKLLFDPPISSAAISSMERIINEFEWRLNVAGETIMLKRLEEIQNGV